MAVTRDEIQDATGRRTFYAGGGTSAGGGHLRGFPMNSFDCTLASGVPTNGKTGFLPGATWQNFKGSAGSAFYINVGTVTSSNWVELTTTNPTNLASITVPANTANTFFFTDGTTQLVTLDSRNTVTSMATMLVTPSPPTIASAASAMINAAYKAAARTITISGTNSITSLLGCGAYLDTITCTDAAAGTISKLSNLHVAANAAAGGSLTITASYMISTGVADCFLTNAGVWTDTASTGAYKKDIEDAEPDKIDKIIDQIHPRTWKYREDVHGDDQDCQRVGIVAEELPYELSTPGPHGGMSAGVLGSFSLAAIRKLRDENRELKQRLERMEQLVSHHEPQTQRKTKLHSEH